MPDEAAVKASSNVKVEDVAYQQVDGKSMLARLYRPAKPLAALVEVHGGAWVSNDRLRNAPIVGPLAADGTMVMSIDFRMPPQAGYPASIADINLAIRWLKSRAAEFGFAADKVGLLGTSSGGHQVLLAAVKPDDPRYGALPLPGAKTDARVAFAGRSPIRWIDTAWRSAKVKPTWSPIITPIGAARRRCRTAARSASSKVASTRPYRRS